MFASFLGLPEGASTVSKGCTCSLQCERANFVLKKILKKIENPCSILFGLQQRSTLSRYVAIIKFLLTNFLVRNSVEPYAIASPFSHLRVCSNEELYAACRHASPLRRSLCCGLAGADFFGYKYPSTF